MSEDLPFQAEYAKSGRAGCKGCKCNIGKDSLRIAKMVQVIYIKSILLFRFILQPRAVNIF